MTYYSILQCQHFKFFYIVRFKDELQFIIINASKLFQRFKDCFLLIAASSKERLKSRLQLLYLEDKLSHLSLYA